MADALTELAEMGTRRVIALSAAFGEMGEQGRRSEARLADIANRHGMVLLGPNCLGVTSPVHAGKFAGLLPDMRPGGVDFISGSGATVDILAEQATRRGLTFHSFVTVGNSAQTGVEDVVELFDQAHGPASSKHIMLYMEKIGSPSKLLRCARSLAEKGRPCPSFPLFPPPFPQRRRYQNFRPPASPFRKRGSRRARRIWKGWIRRCRCPGQ